MTNGFYYHSGDYRRFYSLLASHAYTTRTLKKGEILDLTGQEHYYLLSGLMQVRVNHEEGFQKILCFLGEGTVYPPGPSSDFLPPHEATYLKAVTDTELLGITEDSYYSLCENSNDLKKQVYGTLMQYYNGMLFEISHQSYNSTLIKISNLLYLLSEHDFCPQKNHILLSQQEIAEMLSISRIAVAKNMTQLRNMGVLVTHRSWTEILDKAKLKELCTGETLSLLQGQKLKSVEKPQKKQQKN